MTIPSDIQKPDPGTLIELFILDTTSLGGSIFYFHSGLKANYGKINFQGNPYEPWPIEASGFEWSGGGQSPRPKILISNVGQFLGDINRDYQDLVGAKITRKRTFKKYLDGEPEADPTAEFPQDIYYIEQKTKENKIAIEYELVGAWDMQGVFLPGRLVVGNICMWTYRSSECTYDGGPVATEMDVTTIDLNLDQCGKRLTSCKLRFGVSNPLPYGGFPGVGRSS